MARNNNAMGLLSFVLGLGGGILQGQRQRKLDEQEEADRQELRQYRQQQSSRQLHQDAIAGDLDAGKIAIERNPTHAEEIARNMADVSAGRRQIMTPERRARFVGPFPAGREPLSSILDGVPQGPTPEELDLNRQKAVLGARAQYDRENDERTNAAKAASDTLKAKTRLLAAALARDTSAGNAVLRAKGAHAKELIDQGADPVAAWKDADARFPGTPPTDVEALFQQLGLGGAAAAPAAPAALPAGAPPDAPFPHGGRLSRAVFRDGLPGDPPLTPAPTPAGPLTKAQAQIQGLQAGADRQRAQTRRIEALLPAEKSLLEKRADLIVQQTANLPAMRRLKYYDLKLKQRGIADGERRTLETARHNAATEQLSADRNAIQQLQQDGRLTDEQKAALSDIDKEIASTLDQLNRFDRAGVGAAADGDQERANVLFDRVRELDGNVEFYRQEKRKIIGAQRGAAAPAAKGGERRTITIDGKAYRGITYQGLMDLVGGAWGQAKVDRIWKIGRPE